jgi:hypothetical protein
VAPTGWTPPKSAAERGLDLADSHGDVEQLAVVEKAAVELA